MVWTRYKGNGTDMETIFSMVILRVFVRSIDTDRASKVLDCMKNADDKRSFEGMVTTYEVVASCACCILREV